MTAAVLDVSAVTSATIPWLETAAEFAVGNGKPPADTSYPFSIFYLLPMEPELYNNLVDVETVFPVKMQITTVGQIAFQAMMGGARISVAMAGKDTDGHYLTAAPTIPGFTVIRRRTNRDGYCDVTGDLAQWSETFTWFLHLD